MVKRSNSREGPGICFSPHSTNSQTTSVSSRRSSRYWDEFSNGRRTIDPTFTEKQILPETKAVSARSRDSSAEIGFRTKTVIRDGKAVRSNTSSRENILEHRDGGCYKGLELFKDIASPRRKVKGSSEIAEKLSVSQIATLPGIHRDEDSPGKKRSPSKKNISQITTLPGGSATPPPERSSCNPEKCIMRNISSSVVVEVTVGVREQRRSPLRTVTPTRTDLTSYSQIGREVYDSRRTKGNVSDQSNRQTLDEVKFMKSLKVKPEQMRDLFAPSFRLF